MCYPAQVHETCAKYVRVWGAVISLPDFYRYYFDRSGRSMGQIPKAIDVWSHLLTGAISEKLGDGAIHGSRHCLRAHTRA